MQKPPDDIRRSASAFLILKIGIHKQNCNFFKISGCQGNQGREIRWSEIEGYLWPRGVRRSFTKEFPDMDLAYFLISATLRLSSSIENEHSNSQKIAPIETETRGNSRSIPSRPLAITQPFSRSAGCKTSALFCRRFQLLNRKWPEHFLFER